AARRDSAAGAADLKTQFLVALRDLRRVASEAPVVRKLADTDPAVRVAIMELIGPASRKKQGTLTKIAEPLEYRRSLKSLTDFEKLVRLERVPLERGPDDVEMISATLDGQVPMKMAVDVGSRTTVLPATLAARVNAAPALDAPPVVL